MLLERTCEFGPITASWPMTRGPQQRGARLDAGILADLDRCIDPGRCGIDDGHHGTHVAVGESRRAAALRRG